MSTIIVELAVVFLALLIGLGLGLLWRPSRISVEKVPPELLPLEVPCPPDQINCPDGRRCIWGGAGGCAPGVCAMKEIEPSVRRSPFAPKPKPKLKLKPVTPERERLMGVFLKAKLERIEEAAIPEPPPEPRATHWPKPPAASRLPSIDWSSKT